MKPRVWFILLAINATAVALPVTVYLLMGKLKFGD
jgi:hypothetical protein